MFAIDTNILVYAHNTDAPKHEAAKAFLENSINTQNASGGSTICLPAQVLVEFMNVITWTRLEAHLSMQDAKTIVEDYMHSGIEIIHPKSTQLTTLMELLDTVTSRKKVFDVALVATLKDHGIEGLYTVNTKDFREFEFLDVINPL